MQNGQDMRRFMAYQASKKKPTAPHTQVAHLIADRIILAAMQDGNLVRLLIQEYSVNFEFSENDVLNALKKIADTHRNKVKKK